MEPGGGNGGGGIDWFTESYDRRALELEGRLERAVTVVKEEVVEEVSSEDEGGGTNGRNGRVVELEATVEARTEELAAARVRVKEVSALLETAVGDLKVSRVDCAALGKRNGRLKEEAGELQESVEDLVAQLAGMAVPLPQPLEKSAGPTPEKGGGTEAERMRGKVEALEEWARSAAEGKERAVERARELEVRPGSLGSLASLVFFLPFP